MFVCVCWARVFIDGQGIASLFSLESMHACWEAGERGMRVGFLFVR